MGLAQESFGAISNVATEEVGFIQVRQVNYLFMVSIAWGH
jgi:hypothetical protein